MCGIIGYVGPRLAAPVLIDSLRRLEYRGYDSAGVAILGDLQDDATTVCKSDRKVDDLAQLLDGRAQPMGHTGIGHTRWATHGKVTVANAHPHHDCTGRIHVIHNGIIENFRELREELVASSHTFVSETDTEVVPHLIEELYDGDLLTAVRAAVKRIHGSYALVVVSSQHPDLIVGARLNVPLVVGIGDGETFVSSDISALIHYTKRVLVIGEGQIFAAYRSHVDVTSLDGAAVEPSVLTVDWDVEQAQKGGFPHFMLKEIHEQPAAVTSALHGRIDSTSLVALDELRLDAERVKGIRSITIVACGTAWFAGLVAKYAIEHLSRIPVAVESASEFRYSNPIVDASTLVIAISQSGETADTLAAVREAKTRGAKIVAITNVVGSAIAREADSVMYMQAGPEIGVAATKSFLAQMTCGYLLALHLGSLRGVLADDEHRRLVRELQMVPTLITRVLSRESEVVGIAQRYAHVHNAMFVGRGINYPIALEGALKLKEISYVHAEGYAAGELKHGPIALLDSEMPVIALATEAQTLAKTVSNVEEAWAREAPVIAVVTEGKNPFRSDLTDAVIEVPLCDELISPLVNTVPLQLLAYYIAVERGCNVDQPRNLAKSVVVE